MVASLVEALIVPSVPLKVVASISGPQILNSTARLYAMKKFYMTEIIILQRIFTRPMLTPMKARFVREAVSQKAAFPVVFSLQTHPTSLQAKPKDIAKYRGKYKVDGIKIRRHEKLIDLRILTEGTQLVHFQLIYQNAVIWARKRKRYSRSLHGDLCGLRLIQWTRMLAKLLWS